MAPRNRYQVPFLETQTGEVGRILLLETKENKICIYYGGP